MVYNRSPERVEEFKSYAKDNEVEEEHYEVVTDLKVIGEKWVIFLSLSLQPSPLPHYVPTLAFRPSLLSPGTHFPYFYSRFLFEVTDIRADIVVTSLGSDEAVEEVYAELFGGQEVCPFFFSINISHQDSHRVSCRVDSDDEVPLWLKYGMLLIDRNKVEKEMESFLVEGVDLLSLSIPLPYVPSASFPYLSILPTYASTFPYISPPQSRKRKIDHWRSRAQTLDGKKSSD
jgi:hypothetical protein